MGKAVLPAFGLFILYFLLCAFLVSPFIGWYDSGEMVGATVCLGISHPSGQAVYHLLGKIFLLFPWGTPAFKIGLLSAACGALALSLFWILGLKLAARWGGWKNETELPSFLKASLLLLSLLWALSAPWWRVSVLTEVYALHLGLGLGVLWALASDRPFKWPLVFFLLGVSTVFRPTQMLVLPFVGILFLRELFRREGAGTQKVKGAFLAFIAFLLGRSTLLYLPLRSALEPPIAYGDLTQAGALVKHVMGLGFSKFVGTATLGSILRTMEGAAQHLWTDLTPIGVFLLASGVVLMFRRAKQVPSYLWVGLVWGLMEALLVLAVPYPSFEPHMTLLAWGFAGAAAILPLVWVHRRYRADQWRGLGLILLLILGVFLQLMGVGPLLKARADRGAEDYARNVLGTMGPSALYLPAEENEYFPVVGLQRSEGFRGDVKVVMPGTPLPVFGPWVRQALIEGKPVYLTREWEGLPAGWRFQRKGPLLEITQAPAWEKAPEGQALQAIASWGGIRIERIQFDPLDAVPGGRVGISIDWSREKAGPQDGAEWIMILFTDAEGNFLSRDGLVWLHDIHRAFGGALPFSSMELGRTYREKGEIWIPWDYPPGEYRVMAALQKKAVSAAQVRKAPSGAFYEGRGQDLSKFSGRVAGNSLLHYTTAGQGEGEEALWPVTGSTLRPSGRYFVPLAKLTLRPRND